MAAPARSPETRVLHRTCPTCEATCGLRVEIDPAAGQVVRIEGDPDDVRSQGYLWARGAGG